MPVIERDEKTHIHKIDGLVRPTVTQVLHSVGIINDQWYDDFHREKGSALHLATRYYDEGTLDEERLDPELWSKFESYKKFVDEVDFHPEIIEEVFYHDQYHFFGTPDRFGLVNGTPTLVEIKTGAMEWWHWLQLDAYELLLKSKGYDVRDKALLYLSEDGYRVRRYSPSDRGNLNLFLSALAVAHSKMNHGGSL